MATRRRRRARGRGPGIVLLGSGALLALAQSCAHPPAPVARDLCELFALRAGWQEATLATAARWQVRPGFLLAVIHQESRFRPHARPWWRLLGLPLAPASSAYGYGQATDGTWREYLRAAGRRGARRDDFSDALDFVGWYADRIHRETRLAKDDVYRLYLAYHEGPAGFVRGSHRSKPWLLDVAQGVAARADRFDRDAVACSAARAASAS